MKRFDFAQYSPPWWDVRRGIPTASNFGDIMTAKTNKLSASAVKYAVRLVAEKFDSHYGQRDRFETDEMKTGTRFESEARKFYEMERDTEVSEVGFCMTDDGRFGCSPDALVMDDGVLELKAPAPHTHLAYLLGDCIPDDYIAQCHGHLIVTGREWCDFVSYCPGLPPVLHRVTPNEFTAKLSACLEEFWTLFQSLEAKVRRINDGKPADELKAAFEEFTAMEGDAFDFFGSQGIENEAELFATVGEARTKLAQKLSVAVEKLKGGAK